MLDDTLHASPIGSIISEELDLESHLHPLKTAGGVPNLKYVLLLKSISTVDDLRKSLQLQNLSNHPSLQDQQQVFSVFEAQLRRCLIT